MARRMSPGVEVTEPSYRETLDDLMLVQLCEDGCNVFPKVGVDYSHPTRMIVAARHT
jgi:hypothetical protein